MRRIALLAVLAVMAAAACGLADEPKDLSRVTLPDSDEAAAKALQAWLKARGITSKLYQANDVVLRRGGVLMNIRPLMTNGELDRLRVFAIYYAADEFKKSKALEQMAMKLNRAQNALQVTITDDGNLLASGNITFVDDLPAPVFDAYLDFFAQVVKQHILTAEARKLLK